MATMAEFFGKAVHLATSSVVDLPPRDAGGPRMWSIDPGASIDALLPWTGEEAGQAKSKAHQQKNTGDAVVMVHHAGAGNTITVKDRDGNAVMAVDSGEAALVALVDRAPLPYGTWHAEKRTLV